MENFFLFFYNFFCTPFLFFVFLRRNMISLCLLMMSSSANGFRNKHGERFSNMLKRFSDREGGVCLCTGSVDGDGSDCCCQNSQAAVDDSGVNEHDQQHSEEAVATREDLGVDDEHGGENEARDVDGSVDSPDVTEVNEIVVERSWELVGGKARNQKTEKIVELGNGNEGVSLEFGHTTGRVSDDALPTKAHNEVIHFAIADQDAVLNFIKGDLIDVVSASDGASNDDQTLCSEDINSLAARAQHNEHQEAEQCQHQRDDDKSGGRKHKSRIRIGTAQKIEEDGET